VPWHWAFGLGGIVVITGSLFAQYRLLATNHDVIQEVLTNVERIRETRAKLVAERI
jgi:hypothetical protein